MLQVLVAISQKFCCIKEACGYAKVIHKKRKMRKKWTSVRDIENNGYSDARLKKKRENMNKIAQVFLAKLFPSFKGEIYF